MALDYGKCAREIFSHLGGRENLVSAAHCATRLRLVTVDNSKIDMKALENVDGVKGVFSSNGQLQLIIGTGTVNKVYEEFLAVTGMTAATKDEVKAAAAAQQPLPKRMVKALGDVFVPILPAIVASGLMMGLVEALGHAIPSFAGSDWYSFLDLVSATAFAYLPVLIAVSAARVFGGNIFLGGVVGLCMIHSSFINAWAVAGMETVPSWKLLFFDVPQVGYQGHVIPVIIAVWLMCFIEKQLHKVVPETIDLFVTPLVTVLTTVFFTFTIIGPIFSTAETYVLNFAQWLITVGYGVGALIMGAIYPLTVVCGLHHMYNIIEAGLLSEGNLNIWMPIASAANFAQCGACLAVALKSRNAKNKTVAIPSSMSAALGITEPAIFGVNLRFMKPLICGMIGGAVGAMFGSIMGIGANAYGVTGIPGFLIVDSGRILPYAILLVISGGIAFALTWFVWKEEQPEAASDPASADEDAAAVPTVDCKPGIVYAPVSGTAIPSEEIPDETFAAGVLGQGVGIQPNEGMVVAPCDGEVSTVAETKHAVGISTPDGMELLIHVGVDTVAMNGDGFAAFVQEGQQVKAGDQLITFDRDKIAAAGHPDVVVLLVTNSDDYEDMSIQTGPCQALEQVIQVK